MSWPSSSSASGARRPPAGRPKPPRRQPPLTLRQQQRRNRRGVTMRIIGVLLGAVVLPLALAVTVVVVVGQTDRPAEVPADFRPPTALPRAARPLPIDNQLFASDRAGPFGIYAMRNDGQQARPVVVDPRYQAWGVRLSPDRFTAIFYRSPSSASREASAAGLWAAASDGSGEPVLLRPAGLDGWVVQSHAEWDQYGAFLVMSGGSRANPQIHVTSALGQNPRRLTDRPGINTDPSYTPDGREVFFIGCPGEDCELQDREIYRMPSGGGEPVRVTNDQRPDREPYVSPQGDRLMWLSVIGTEAGDGWQIRMADRAGDVIDNPRSLLPLSGEEVVGRAQWSLDGTTVFVHRKVAGRAATGIFAISTNSPQGPRELTLGQPGNHENPTL